MIVIVIDVGDCTSQLHIAATLPGQKVKQAIIMVTTVGTLAAGKLDLPVHLLGHFPGVLHDHMVKDNCHLGCSEERVKITVLAMLDSRQLLQVFLWT
jgi:hypothetical protein